ncbi:phage tail sheath subtilisin-like domain-containing protein [Streptomyces polychromogenes]|uniref:Phage tail sheath subtilisin-like domain-containing protein n=1 Tax=Streptomyces polychromogenes TaxID=67342 RepID=A0ABP3FI00_9ACTN
MPVNPTYPGVYIDEVKSAVRTITGVPTSVAAFVGTALRGPTDRPVHLTSFADFQRVFGGVAPGRALGYAVYQFYANGGSEAEVVRLVHTGDSDDTKNAKASALQLPGSTPVPLVARGEGTWGDALRVRVDHDTSETVPAGGAPTLYNLTVFDRDTGATERFLNVSSRPADANALDKALVSSALVAVPATGAVLNAVPTAHAPIAATDPSQDPFDDAKPTRYTQALGGAEGAAPGPADYQGGATGQADKKGLYQLLKTDIFNLLCLPGAPAAVRAPAAALCLERRALYLVDPPASWTGIDSAVSGMATPPVAGDTARNAAVYFPELVIPDPAQNGVPVTVAPCGTLAGVMARTDVQRGVWKAPAGTDASLAGVSDLTVPMTDPENGRLNRLGVNCLRSFPVIGPVAWGARTLRGADRLADPWKYLPVRRLALFIEESLYRGTQWVVFEPNDEPLWSSIRLNVGAFMNGLFRQGAFQGATAREAYLVKCDRENNPQNDVDRGIVNVVVGFAPLKPAEFVIIHIEQLAGQLQV